MVKIFFNKIKYNKINIKSSKYNFALYIFITMSLSIIILI